MHRLLKSVGLASLAAMLALIAAPAMAQPKDGVEAARPSSEQEAVIASWPDDKKAAYQLWPANAQAYFWTLGAERQKIFWALSDSDKLALATMPEGQRAAAWTQIEARARPPRSE